MRANLAEALGVADDAVGLKATTTEGMGFEGRGEGIAASAVCLLLREGESRRRRPRAPARPAGRQLLGSSSPFSICA